MEKKKKTLTISFINDDGKESHRMMFVGFTTGYSFFGAKRSWHISSNGTFGPEIIQVNLHDLSGNDRNYGMIISSRLRYFEDNRIKVLKGRAEERALEIIRELVP